MLDKRYDHFLQRLHRHCRDRADAPAVTFCNGVDDITLQWTYGALDRRSTRVAAAIAGRTAPGDRVVIVAPNDIAFVTAFIACLRCGRVAVPVSPPRRSQRGERFAAVIQDCDATLIMANQIHHDALVEVLPDIPVLLVDPALWDDPEQSGLAIWDDVSTTPAFLQYTSGSTGVPKGVVVTHANLAANLAQLDDAMGGSLCRPGEVAVSWMPFHHDFGLIGMLLHSLAAGWEMVLLPSEIVATRPLQWLRVMAATGAVVTGSPNFAFDLCVDADDKQPPGDLSRVRCMLNGAEPVRAQSMRRFRDRFAAWGLDERAICPAYGMAETTLHIASVSVDKAICAHTVDGNALASGRVDPGKDLEFVDCGRPHPAMVMLIVDPDTCAVLPEDRIGEIWVQGPSVAAGYWNRPDETAATFAASTADGRGPFLRTGDLGYLHDNRVVINGRLKDLIIVRGANHHPCDLEHTAEAAHPAVAVNASAAFQDVDGRVVLTIESTRSARREFPVDAAGAAIRAAVLAEHGVAIDTISFLRPRSIARTTSGKIQRRAMCRVWQTDAIANEVGRWQATAPAHDAAVTAKETHPAAQALRDRLERFLATYADGPIDLDLDFAAYGLDSLAATRLAGELGGVLGRPVSEGIVYDHPTPRQLLVALGAPPAAPAAPVDDRDDDNAIAVIGMACRFPGAGSIAAYAELLRQNTGALRDLPPQRWADIGLPSRFALPPGLTTGGYLAEVDRFEPEAFGISQAEAERMDPQQRLLLEVSAEVLADAGLAAAAIAGGDCGVFVGICSNDYAHICPDALARHVHHATGTALAMAANRISYHFDLLGPSVAVDTACSSSLVAVHQAVRALRAGDCTQALAGGVNLVLRPATSEAFASGGMLSPRYRCATFGADADGYVRGEGCGMVLLKPLAQARRDGDRLHAVIRGSAIGSDGHSNGLTAPRGPAQERVIARAWADAGMAVDKVDMIEAHGTGTRLGDTIEIDAWKRLLSSAGALPKPITSVKAAIGHLEGAAGIAGMIAAVLGLRHRRVHPIHGLTAINPAFGAEPMPVRPCAQQQGLPATGPVRAGVSSFGFGGALAHVVLESAPVIVTTPRAPLPPPRWQRRRIWYAQLPGQPVASSDAAEDPSRAVAPGPVDSDDRGVWLETWLRTNLTDVEVDPAQPLVGLGIDSIMMTDLKAELQQRFDVTVEITDLYQGLTVADLRNIIGNTHNSRQMKIPS